MSPTRFPPLGLDRIGREWSFFDTSDGQEHRVGPIYKTKMEALADLHRYARESWGMDV